MVRVAKTQREEIETILRKLSSVGNVEGVAVVSRDGLLIADALPKNIDAEIFSSMTATMHGAAETAISELKKGSGSQFDAHIVKIFLDLLKKKPSLWE